MLPGSAPNIDWGPLLAEVGEPDRLPDEGPALMECTAARWDVSSGGWDQLALRHVILDGPDAGIEIRSWQTLSDHPAARKIFVRCVQAHAVDPLGVGTAGVPAAMVGAEVVGIIHHDDYTGEPRPKVKKWLPPDRAATAADARPAAGEEPFPPPEPDGGQPQQPQRQRRPAQQQRQRRRPAVSKPAPRSGGRGRGRLA